MGTLYLCEQNSYLRKTSKRLRVEKDDQVLCELPAIKVDRVVIFGNVQISTQALNFLLKEGIDTALLSMRGKLYGRLIPAENKNVFLRLHQYRAYYDEAFRLQFSKELVRSKLKNGRRFLQRLSYGREYDISHSLDEMNRCVSQIDACQSTKSLRGYEGQGTAAYFQGFGQFVKGFSFTGRNRRPPKDPVNSLLSFGYTLLADEISAAITAGGLDPYLGFFHEAHYGRASLCFDLCEEFRHLIVDGLVLDVINHQKIKKEDFELDEETGKICLTPDAQKIFLAAFEHKMSDTRRTAEAKPQTYRLSIHEQVNQLRKAVEGKEDYKGYRYT